MCELIILYSARMIASLFLFVDLAHRQQGDIRDMAERLAVEIGTKNAILMISCLLCALFAHGCAFYVLDLYIRDFGLQNVGRIRRVPSRLQHLPVLVTDSYPWTGALLSFVCHSLGGLIVRAALGHELMKPLHRKVASSTAPPRL